MSDVSQEQKDQKTDIQFSTKNIGKWNSKQENPFAEQNRKKQAKREERDKKRQKAGPFIVIGGSALVIIAAIVGLVLLVINLTKILPLDVLTESDTIAIRDEAQKIFDRYTDKINLEDTENLSEKDKENIQKALDAVRNFYKQQSDRATNDEVVTQVALEEMSFYIMNKQPDPAIAIADGLLAKNNLDNMQLSNVYDLLQSAYYFKDDEEKIEYYFQLMVEVIGEDYVAG